MKRLSFPLKPIAIAMGVGLIARLVMAWTNYGFKYMDEHWQVIEPANSLVHGVWHRTIEWQEGHRSWIYPWFVSWMIRLVEALGINDPVWIAASLRSIHGMLGTLAIGVGAWLCWRVSDVLGTSTRTRTMATLITAWYLALWPYSVYSGIHLHGEMVGAFFIALAGLTLLGERFIATGALLGVAFTLKIDLAVAGLCCGIWYALQRNTRACAQLAAGALPFAFLVGLVDKLTWGQWFSNVIGHARVNIVEEIGNQWGVSPWYYHLLYFISMASLPALFSLISLPKIWRKLPEPIRSLWFQVLGFIAVFSYMDHKEKRFMAPLIYLGIALSVATAAKVWEQTEELRKFLPLKFRKAALAVTSLCFLIHVGTEVRNYIIERPWHERVQALANAARIPDAQKYISLQWPAVFYYPRHIPAISMVGTKEAIAAETAGYDIVAMSHDGKHNGWWEEAGFDCKPWPKPPRESKDPVPVAYRCERKK